ncbi:hypothetical protein Leryth_023007 [Lithospermum erythrorhizon]|nr:hypothetical protein Leryth_023007 [Lithospermum erythrorhizon]
MATLSGFITSPSGLVSHRNGLCIKPFIHKKIRFLSSQISHGGVKCQSYAGKNHQNSNFGYDELNEDPYWVIQTGKAIWAVKSLAKFLVEQPSQLKYIEWPSFWSTLKTATLTLVLVGLLIVALSSVDSGLSYLLAVLLRKLP